MKIFLKILITSIIVTMTTVDFASAQNKDEVEKIHPGMPLQVGITRCYEARYPIAVFNASQDKVSVTTILLPRNPLDAIKTPLPRVPQNLPDVLTLTLGRYSDDLVQMADLGLIEPIDSLLLELGLDTGDMLSTAREAVTYRGHIWGIPWHAIMHTMVSHKILLPEKTPDDSWESLLESVSQLAQNSEETTFALSIPFSEFRLAEQLATSAGGEVFSCSNPRALVSEPYLKAFRLIAQYKAQGQLSLRMENTPIKRGDFALLGEVYLDSIYEGNEYGVKRMPSKLMKQDPLVKSPQIPALMEVFAVRANNSASREAVKTFLQWMMKVETHWMVFQATNDVIQTREWVLDSVHVPLWESLLNAPLFKGAGENFPDYKILVENVRHMRILRSVPQLDESLTLMVEEYVTSHLGQADFEDGLLTLVTALEKLVLQTPVESHTYDAY